MKGLEVTLNDHYYAGEHAQIRFKMRQLYENKPKFFYQLYGAIEGIIFNIGLVEVLSKIGTRESLNILESLLSEYRTVEVDSFNIFLTDFFKRKRDPNMVESLFHKYISPRIIKPSTRTINILMESARFQRKFDAVKSYYRLFDQFQLKKDSATYSTLVKIASSVEEIDEIWTEILMKDPMKLNPPLFRCFLETYGLFQDTSKILFLALVGAYDATLPTANQFYSQEFSIFHSTATADAFLAGIMHLSSSTLQSTFSSSNSSSMMNDLSSSFLSNSLTSSLPLSTSNAVKMKVSTTALTPDQCELSYRNTLQSMITMIEKEMAVSLVDSLPEKNQTSRLLLLHNLQDLSKYSFSSSKIDPNMLLSLVLQGIPSWSLTNIPCSGKGYCLLFRYLAAQIRTTEAMITSSSNIDTKAWISFYHQQFQKLWEYYQSTITQKVVSCNASDTTNIAYSKSQNASDNQIKLLISDLVNARIIHASISCFIDQISDQRSFWKSQLLPWLMLYYKQGYISSSELTACIQFGFEAMTYAAGYHEKIEYALEIAKTVTKQEKANSLKRSNTNTDNTATISSNATATTSSSASPTASPTASRPWHLEVTKAYKAKLYKAFEDGRRAKRKLGKTGLIEEESDYRWSLSFPRLLNRGMETSLQVELGVIDSIARNYEDEIENSRSSTTAKDDNNNNDKRKKPRPRISKIRIRW
jgi:hypothetical protein